MKNSWLLLILLIFSCNTTTKHNITDTNLEEVRKDKINEDIIHQFKLVVFRGCLSGSYVSKLVNDRSFAQDFPLGLEGYQYAGNLGEMMVEKIHQDSIEWSNKICKGCDSDEELRTRFEANGMIGKRVLSICLDYYTSTELDSIARNYLYPNDLSVWTIS